MEPIFQSWPTDQPIAGVNDGGNHAIAISVEHKLIGPDGRISDRKATATASTHLLAGDTLQPTTTIIVNPRHLLKVYEMGGRGEGPQLSIRLRNNTTISQQQPTISLTPINLPLLAAEWGCPGIVNVVESMLRTTAGAMHRTDNGFLIRKVPTFRLEPADRGVLNDYLRKSGIGALRFPVRIQATGAQPVVQQWELNPQGNIREGLIVFDLGTSTSVACQFDPNFVESSVFPREQFVQLRSDLAEFMATPDKVIIQEAETYWLKLLQEVCVQRGLGGEGDPARKLLAQLGFTANSDRGAEDFYELLRHFELQLWSIDIPIDPNECRKLLRFQERISAKLHYFYARSFEKMPLEQWMIRLCRPDGEAADYVVSELELIDLEPLPTGVLGRRSAERRIQWLSGKGEPSGPAALGTVRQGRFFECPKRFLPHIHEDRDVAEMDAWPVEQLKDGSNISVVVTPRQVLQASWQYLIDVASGPNKPGLRGIDQVAATYPANLMPEPRSQLEQALRELGMVKVHLDFDESISPAIFHLEQLFGNMEEIGCEAFKVQCVREGNLWAYHMLVLDIGAGTTDMSLIRLEMRERLPDASEFGGRLYEITPRLLGAAGRSQSGGHQLTLMIFRVLKQLVASWVREAASGANASPAQPPVRSFEFVLYAEKADDLKMTPALELAENIIPTRFHDLYTHLRANLREKTDIADLTKARRQIERFDILWKWAEDLKIYLSELVLRTPREELPRSVSLDAFVTGGSSWLKETMDSLLTGTDYHSNLADILNATLNPIPSFRMTDFQELAGNANKSSISLATSMAASALENYGKRLGDEFNLSLQCVVLSGRACALPEVQEELKRQLRFPKLGSGKAKILFRTEYAKSATAIGACRAQRRIANARANEGPVPRLEGKCEMDIRIENLFFYLPASYHLGTGGNQLGKRVFALHTEFKQYGTAPLGLIRSDGEVKGAADATSPFMDLSREMLLLRDDGDRNGVLQGRLVVQDLVAGRSLPNRRLAIECDTWRVRFEINHRRQLSALLIRPLTVATAAAYTFDPIYDIGNVSSDPLTIVELDKKAMSPLLAASKDKCPIHIYTKPPGVNSQPLLSAHEMSPIRCLASTSKVTNTNAAPTSQIVAGWLSPVMTSAKFNLPHGGRITLYLVNANTNKEIQTVTVEPIPKDPDNPDMPLAKFPFSVSYRIVLTVDGRFALIIGEEAMYWETADVDEWLISPEGRILRRNISPPPQTVPWWREPFCGQH